MTGIAHFFYIAFVAMIAENIVFSRSLGMGTLISMTKNKNQMLGFSLSIIYMSVISCLIAFFTNSVLNYFDLNKLFIPIIYIILLSVVYVLTLLIMWKWFYKTFVSMKKYIHLSTFNYAVFGAALLSMRSYNTIIEYLAFGIGSGLGFALATLFISIANNKLYSEKVPGAFKGLPLILIYMGIISMAFYGLLGHKLSL